MKTQSRPSGERTTFAPTEERAPNRAVATTSGTLPVRTSGPTGAAAGATAGAVPAERAPGGPISWLTLENGLYLLFFALALITRFWDLGAKGLHHDESLHSVYSWKYYMDQGYIHSPMMHGPEQFHFIDLFYLLFGATDATARFASATCGVFLVMAPWFLRRQLGRWPALIASFLLLISPGFMYFTRFAREDAIYAAMEMLFVMGLWRFVDERKPRDFYLMCAGYSLMFTIKESAYLTTAVVGLLLVGLFAWQMGRLLFTTFAAYLAAAGGLALIILKLPSTPKMPNIPAETPTPENIQNFVTALIAHPLIQAMAGVTVLWLAVWGYLLWDQSRRIRAAAPAPVAAPLPVEEAEDVSRWRAPVRRVVSHAAGTDTQTVVLAPADTNGHADAAAETNGHAEPGLAANGHAEAANGYGEPEAAANGHAPSDLEAGDAAPDAEAGAPVPGAGTDGDGTEVEGAGEPEVGAPVVARRPRRVVVEAAPGLLERYQPGSVPYAVGYLLRHPTVLATGVAVGVLIFVALYTSLFTNINGIGTGLFGSLGYWLAQQDVRRGDQPWFYYFLIIPVYEPLIIVFSLIGMLYFAWKGVRALIDNRRTAAVLYALSVIFFPIAIPVFLVLMLVRAFRRPVTPVVPGATANFNVGQPVAFSEFRPFLVLFLMAWFLGAITLYSWAGEKMPWLQIHIVQPMAFLAALGLGQLVKSMIRHRRIRAATDGLDEFAGSGRYARTATVGLSPWTAWTQPASWVPFWSFIALFALVTVFGVMSLTHRVMTNDYTNWWQLAIWPALLVLLLAGYWSVVGGGRVLRYALVGVLGVLTIYGLRSAVQLSFYHAMDAREMAVYVQTAPDLVRVANTLDALSVDQTGALDLKVIYDSEASWPMEWYFRDYKNKQFIPGGPTTAPDPQVAALVVDVPWYDKWKAGQAPQLANYEGIKIVQRWWFPEDTYRNFVPDAWDDLDPAKPYNANGTPNFRLDANGKRVKSPVRQAEGTVDTILYTLRTPSEQGKLWKYLIYREPYAALGSTDMVLFIRKDLVSRYHYLADSLDLPNYDSMLSR